MHLLVGRSFRYICFGSISILVFVASLTLYICSNQTCSLSFLDSPYYSVRWHKLKANRRLLLSSNRTFQNELNSNYERQKIIVAKSDFDIKGSDVIVFLHIQNTGGSVFARHMVEDLRLDEPCRCKKNRRICRCYRPNNYGSTWFFSRYTTGWRCGVHPDWAELSSCVDRVMDEDEGKPVKRRYFFVTILRDPVKRFISEFWHLRHGRTWPPAPRSHPRCGWSSSSEACPEYDRLTTLGEFANCTSNPAVNRQARMLSDLAPVDCHGTNSSVSVDDGDLIVLTSAKNNLHKMSFFGLSEFPRVSQYVFEATFGLSFGAPPRGDSANDRSGGGRGRRKKELFRETSARDVEKVGRVNHLDTELYYYAKELLFYRFEKLKKVDPSFENYFQFLSRSNLSQENWADREDFLDSLLD